MTLEDHLRRGEECVFDDSVCPYAVVLDGEENNLGPLVRDMVRSCEVENVPVPGGRMADMYFFTLAYQEDVLDQFSSSFDSRMTLVSYTMLFAIMVHCLKETDSVARAVALLERFLFMLDARFTRDPVAVKEELKKVATAEVESLR